MTQPNTWAILQRIESLITSTNLYTTVAIGAVKDWADACPVCEIMFVQDDSEHYAQGGKIRDPQGIRITTGISFTTQTPAQAVQQLTTIRDTIVPMFQQRATLQDLSGVQDSRIKPKSSRIAFMLISGNDYLVHECIVEVRSTYNVPIGPGDA